MEVFIMLVLLPIIILVAVPIIILIFNSKKLKQVTQRVENIETKIERLERLMNARETTIISELPDTLPDQEIVVETIPEEPGALPPAEKPGLPAPKPMPAIVREPGIKKSRSRDEWETVIGGRWLNRIGALALIIGFGFFLKFAFDNKWLTETVQVLIGAAFGSALLFGGWRFHQQDLKIFAQGLVGAGIAILYLSVYASYNFYHLVPQAVAFILMSIVTILAFQQALQYNSLAVSLLGWAGGFLTPFLLDTGLTNEVGVFTYIFLLGIGLLALLTRKEDWMILEPLTLAAIYFTYFAWFIDNYVLSHFYVTLLFLTLFWGLFFALDVFHIFKATHTFHKTRQWAAVANAVLYYTALYAIINPTHKAWMSFITLLVGAVYCCHFLLFRLRRVKDEFVLARYTLLAIVFLVIATGIEVSGLTLVTGWALEALILVFLGIQWRLHPVWYAALGLFVLATVKLIVTQGAFGYPLAQEVTMVFNQRTLAYSVLAAALATSTIFFNKLDEKSVKRITSILHYGWSILLFIWCTVATNDFFRQLLLSTKEKFGSNLEFIRYLALAISWTVYSLPMVWSGLLKKIHPILFCGLGTLILAMVNALIYGIMPFDPIEKFTAVINVRALILIVVLAGAFVHLHWLKKYRQTPGWMKRLLNVLKVAIVLVIFSLITGETRDFFGRIIHFTDESAKLYHLKNMQQLALSGAWLIYSVLVMMIGMWRRIQVLRIMAIVLFGVAILKIFIYDLSFLDTLYRIYSFIGLGLILLAVSYLYQRFKGIIFNVTLEG